MIAPNTILGHYEIITQLGKGGMGEVWRALDTHLNREVAIKVLPADYANNADRLRRFEQEARATSALNHPNILTVHEFGLHEGAPYIVAELLEGEELRAALKRGAIGLLRALDYAQQIVSGLAAAHAKNIVHRDLKPENLFVTTDGFVKILDFGLAKLRPPETIPDSEAPTQRKITDPGTVMGTASYMSPEQARGQEVDARSDIFSLGVTLYEMIAGCATFTGVNALDVIGAILNQEPAPLRQFVPDVPAELQRIVTKALRKDRDERYQHVKDLLLDVKELKQELEFAAKLKGAQAFVVPPSVGMASGARDLPPEGGTTNAQAAEAATNEVTAARTTSSAEIILGEIKRHKAGMVVGLAVTLGCVALLAYGVYRFAAPKQGRARFQNVKFTRLTSVGNVRPVSVSVSPDGKFIAYVQTEAGQNSLWTKAVATGSTVQIVAPAENDLFNTTFSPDGDYVYYQQREGKTILYQIPVLGGTPKKVLTEIDSIITFSPDGKQFAFTRSSADRTESQLIVVNADGSGERILAERQIREPFFGGSSWSPDGKIIATTASSIEGDIRKPVLLSVSVGGGEVRPLVRLKDDLRTLNNVMWFKDGEGLALIASEQGGFGYQIWYVSYPGGEVRRITNDLANYPSLSLTADNNALVTDQTQLHSNLWITPLNASDRVQQITRGDNREGAFGMRWAGEGRVVYNSTASGNSDIWLVNVNGSGARQLTNDSAFDYNPAVSSDGRYLVFTSIRSGRMNLWRTDLDGGNPKPLTAGETDAWFDLSPDGRWAVFLSLESGTRKLYKVLLEGGSPVLLSDERFNRPAISPDGKLIACLSSSFQSSQSKVVILPFEGGATVKTVESKFTVSNTSPLRWAQDGRALIYVDTQQGATNLWRLPLDGSPPQPVTNFNDAKPERIWNFDLSRDGKQLIIARGDQSADVVLISEVK